MSLRTCMTERKHNLVRDKESEEKWSPSDSTNTSSAVRTISPNPPSLCPSAPPTTVEAGPHDAVEEAQQRVLGRGQLHAQHDQRRGHLHHLQQHHHPDACGRAPRARPQKDLQQRQQDRQDVPHHLPRAFRDLQPSVLGHLPQQGTHHQRGSVTYIEKEAALLSTFTLTLSLSLSLSLSHTHTVMPYYLRSVDRDH